MKNLLTKVLFISLLSVAVIPSGAQGGFCVEKFSGVEWGAGAGGGAGLGLLLIGSRVSEIKAEKQSMGPDVIVRIFCALPLAATGAAVGGGVAELVLGIKKLLVPVSIVEAVAVAAKAVAVAAGGAGGATIGTVAGTVVVGVTGGVLGNAVSTLVPEKVGGVVKEITLGVGALVGAAGGGGLGAAVVKRLIEK